MKRKYLLAVTCAAALWSVAALALPSTAQVQAAVKAGDYPKAESMMQEVVTAKPQSAKAHYIYAEILAHDAKFSEAAVQARKAREIDPEIGFTDPDKFRAFEQTLNREQAAPVTAPVTATQAAPMRQAPMQAASGGTPGWVWGLGFAVVAFLIWRMVSRRAATAGGMAPAGAGGYGMQPGAPQPGYGPGYGGGGGYGPGYGQAPGGGLLRTGLAAAGGVAAGMLVEKMIDGNHRNNDNYGNGGSQGGMFDGGSNQAATELENRPVDFGSGNDWGGDAGGGSDNFTPSGGGDDGGW
jgi:hypothetical protein